MALKFIYNSPFLKKLYLDKLGQYWIERKVAPFETYLSTSETIIDIGSGNGLICDFFRKKGYQITPLDVENLAYSEDVTPVVYDGVRIPFEDKHFDVALILTVLHHIPEPEKTLAEAKRVAKRIIIIEDIYTNPVQKYLTFFMDWLVNFGYSATPHTNKDDEGWKKTFSAFNLDLTAAHYQKVLLFFKQAIYILKDKDYYEQ